jgi:gamma-D-glutamyl-L-lysine dipeptidyl-peptidase
MTDTAASIVEEVSGLFADTRVEHCRLQVSEPADGKCTLTGAVLDQVTLSRVQDQLGTRLPGIEVDCSGVRVLRPPAGFATAGTNLTGLYAQPSFLAEQISQLLNGWPLEVLKEEGNWRFVRQTDGYLGWAYATYLSGPTSCTLTHLVCAPEARVYTEPDESSPLGTRVLGGTAVAVDGNEGEWRHIALAGQHSGWLRAEALRSFDSLPDTPDARRGQIIADAKRFIGVQYLWGGCSAWGIDCSGFAQLVHRLSGVTLLRDADMQYHAGRPVEYPFKPGDLLFFGDDEKRKIDHVTISLGGWDIIHSSRRINGVYLDNVQSVQGLRDSFMGARTFLE